MNIDLSKVISMVGEQTIVEIGAPLGLSKETSVKVANSLAENFRGNNRDEAVAAAAKDAGVGKEVVEQLLAKLIDKGKDMAVDAAKGEVGKAARGFFGKLMGR